jgi:hypothetical protein
VGVIIAPLGRLLLVLDITRSGERIAAIVAITDARLLRRLDLSRFLD